MRHLFSFVLFISFYNFSVVMAESQSIVSDESQIVEIGGGLSVETVPPKFITMGGGYPPPSSTRVGYYSCHI